MQPSLLLSPVLEVEPSAAMTLGESEGERSLEDMTLLTAMAFSHTLYPCFLSSSRGSIPHFLLLDAVRVL